MFLRKAKYRVFCGVPPFMVFFQCVSVCVPIHTGTGKLSQGKKETLVERLPLGLSWGHPTTVHLLWLLNNVSVQ